MSNSITLAKAYAAALDKVYKMAATTAILDAPNEYVRAGATAGSFLVAKRTLVGLGTYNKATGYPAGDVTLTWEEHSYSYDRGRTFSVDAMDNIESAGQAFGALAGDFVREQVVPEIDAVRFMLLANGAAHNAYATIDASSEWVAAIDVALETLFNHNVPLGNMVLFTKMAGYNYLKRADENARFTAPGANPDATFASWDGIPLIVVPEDRFYSEASLDAGSSGSAGGYTHGIGTLIDFVLMDKTAAFADVKHAAPRIFDPSVNQTADAWKFDYRVYHDLFILDNKADGIYVHTPVVVS